MKPHEIEIRVRYSSGTYLARTRGGHERKSITASCTGSSMLAAEAVCRKVFAGGRFLRLTRAGSVAYGIERWNASGVLAPVEGGAL